MRIKDLPEVGKQTMLIMIDLDLKILKNLEKSFIYIYILYLSE